VSQCAFGQSESVLALKPKPRVWYDMSTLSISQVKGKKKMEAPDIGQARNIVFEYEVPCQDDTETWSFAFSVHIRRISKIIYDVYWKEHSLGKGQFRLKLSSIWWVVKMCVHRELYRVAYDHAKDWNEMDNSETGIPQ
jgi:hypothetical protein